MIDKLLFFTYNILVKVAYPPIDKYECYFMWEERQNENESD